MNILITGGAGYIGSHTAKWLSSRGHKPVVLDTLENGYRDFVRWGPFYQGHCGDTDLVKKIIRQEDIASVIHFAGYAYVGESVDNPLKYFKNNTSESVQVLSAIRDSKLVRSFVFSSTCATYGIPNEVPIQESEKQEPVNPYGHSKLMTEQILRDFSTSSAVKVTALRYFNAAGADLDGVIGEDHQPETHLIPLGLKACYDDSYTLKVFGNDYGTPDGSCIRDYIHVYDLADAHLKAIEVESEKSFRAFNVGTGHGYSVFEIIKEVERQTGKKVKYQLGPRRAGDPEKLVANATHIQQELCWKPRYSELSNIISTANSWYKRKFNFT